MLRRVLPFVVCASGAVAQDFTYSDQFRRVSVSAGVVGCPGDSDDAQAPGFGLFDAAISAEVDCGDGGVALSSGAQRSELLEAGICASGALHATATSPMPSRAASSALSEASIQFEVASAGARRLRGILDIACDADEPVDAAVGIIVQDEGGATLASHFFQFGESGSDHLYFTESLALEPGRYSLYVFARAGISGGQTDCTAGFLIALGAVPCEPCRADMNGDGAINHFDFLAYQTAFSNEDPAADLAMPYGVFNLFDFLAYQAYFGNGC